MPLEGLLLDRYRLLRLIRRGGMGEIYLAEDTRMPRQVAIKVMQVEGSLYPDAQATRDASRLFEREMRAATTLDSPHILPLLDFGEQNVNGTNVTYMVMPYRPEGSLADWLRQRGSAAPLAPTDVASIVHQAAEALQHAHDHQIVHLDIKPSNFLIRNRPDMPNQPDILLADFGIAKFTGTSKGSNAIRGTLEYMAPEQWRGQPTPASDQYALAIMAYELLTGRVPFRGNVAELINQHNNIPPHPPSRINARIPAAIDQVILKALSKKPEDRYPSVRAFADALQRAVSTGTPIHTSYPPTPLPPTQPTRGKDIYMPLPISGTEAMTGSMRAATLPNGRVINVHIPAGAYNGQTIRMEGFGEPSTTGGMPGALIFTLSVTSTMPPRSAAAFPQSAQPTPLPLSQPVSRPARRSGLLIIGIIALVVLVIGVGLFALLSRAGNGGGSGSNTPIVSDTDLTATAQVSATAAVIKANPDPYQPTTGTLAFYDPMTTQNSTWSSGANCSFSNGAFHITEATKGFFQSCYATRTNFSNFALEAKMTLLSGDCGGVLFRANENTGALYFYRLCYDSRYRLTLYVSNSGSTAKQLANAPSSTIVGGTGASATNLIAVVANGSTIDLYANGKKLDSITDSTYTHGEIGLFGEDINNSANVAFNNVKVWTL